MNQKTKIYIILFAMLGILILTLYFININSQTRKIVISDNTLEQISQINWSNEDWLLQMGFDKYENDFYYINTEGDIPYKIIITKNQNPPAKTNKYKNISYSFEETSSIGKLSVKRIWIDEIVVIRRYFIYANGMEISMIEDNIEDSAYLFEKAIAKLTITQDGSSR